MAHRSKLVASWRPTGLFIDTSRQSGKDASLLTNAAMKAEHTARSNVGVEAPFQLFQAAGATLAVSRRGAGLPVLCLSATGHGGRDFVPLAERIEHRGFQVITVDWPGHGNSPDVPLHQPVSASFYAEILSDLIPQLSPPPVAPLIIGNSIGGAAAIRLAHRRPELVGALVICNAGGLADLSWTARAVIRLMVRFFESGARGAVWFPAAFALYYRLVLQQPVSAAQRARIVRASRELAPLLSRAWDSFQRPEEDVRDLVAQVEARILWAWAKDDKIVAWNRSKAAALTAPNCQFLLFPGGHSPFLEAPDAFAKAFVEFAKTLPCTSRLSTLPSG